MLERIKKALVESFVGVIVVGMLFADGIGSLISGISIPLGNWISLWIQQTKVSAGFPTPAPQFSIDPFFREWISAVCFLLVAFLLLRWLYMEPRAAEPSDPAQEEEPEESA